MALVECFSKGQQYATLTCGYGINWSRYFVTRPSRLRLLTLQQFLPWLKGVMSPGSLQAMICGYRLNQSLRVDDDVHLAVGELWPQVQPEYAWRYDRVKLPNSLQTLTCDYRIIEGLSNSPQTLTCGTGRLQAQPESARR